MTSSAPASERSPEHGGEEAGRDRLGPNVSGLMEGEKPAFQGHLCPREIATLQQRLAVGDQEVRPERAVVVAQVQRMPVVTLCHGHIQRHRPVAGCLQGAHGRLDEAAGELALPGRLRQLERGLVVMHEDLRGGFLLLAALDPMGHRRVLGRLHTARQRRVGDLTGEPVPERVLDLAGEGRGAHSPDEFPLRQRLESAFDLALVDPAHSRHGPGPERLPHHRGVREHALQLGVQGVEPGRHERQQGVGQDGPRSLFAGAPSMRSGTTTARATAARAPP